RRGEPYLRTTTPSASPSSSTTTPVKTTTVTPTHQSSTTNSSVTDSSQSLTSPTSTPSSLNGSLAPSTAPPPPPPPPLPPLLHVTNGSSRPSQDSTSQSAALHSSLSHTITSNGDYRSTLYPSINNQNGLLSSTPIPPPPPAYSSNSTLSRLVQHRDEPRRKESESSSSTTNTKTAVHDQQQLQPQQRIREISSNVGFVSLPDQVHRRAVKRGFEFNLMVVGQSGLGKSTFINTLFQTELYGQDFPSTVHRKKKTVSIDSSSIILKEKGVQLRLTIVDTPGFGDAVDNSNCWQPILDYIDSKYEEFLNAESRVIRRQASDNRVHCCLYFISPTGHSLQPLDIEFMKRLHDRVNIIPVIAKADTLTSDELRIFKKSILQDIHNEKVKLYEFPDCDDDEENKLTKTYKEKVPFAVVGSNIVLERANKRARVRQYAWGIVDVEDEAHSDFIALRSMLIRTNLIDLRDVTHNIHYENYRYKKLSHSTSSGTTGTDSTKAGSNKSLQSNKNFFSQLEDERAETELRLEKMSRDMEAVYQSKVTEKLQKLEESKQNVLKTQESYRQSLQQEDERLSSKREEFEKHRREWDESSKVFESSGSLTQDIPKLPTLSNQRPLADCLSEDGAAWKHSTDQLVKICVD
ncbi:unnamed protein product, partial [Didymodactylos carnosus]